jgi:glycosyltransferase involved in cell wall biosynthesis
MGLDGADESTTMDIPRTGPPLVSVIIPTYRRPDVIRDAISSVLAQTYAHLEVIVVSDGPDPQTAAAVSGMDDRVIYHELAVNSGPAEARNAGVAISRGQWIGFLDDDDAWLPRKLEAQLAVADLADKKTLIACRCVYRHSNRQDIWPARPIADNEDIADYILRRSSLFGHPGIIAIHSLLVPREIMLQVPLVSLKDHEDWAWLLEVWHNAGARVRFVWEPLVVYNIATESISRSRRMNWEDSLAFADDNRQWIGPSAYNSFLVTKVALKAKRRGDWHGLGVVARKVLANRPSLLDLTFLAGMALLPSSLLNMAWKRSLRSSETATPSAAHPGSLSTLTASLNDDEERESPL